MRQNPYIRNYKKICKENNINFFQCKNKGIYLLESNDLINWSFVQDEPVIQSNTKYNNFTISIEKKFPCFDSNLCCFYYAVSAIICLIFYLRRSPNHASHFLCSAFYGLRRELRHRRF